MLTEEQRRTLEMAKNICTQSSHSIQSYRSLTYGKLQGTEKSGINTTISNHHSKCIGHYERMPEN